MLRSSHHIALALTIALAAVPCLAQVRGAFAGRQLTTPGYSGNFGVNQFGRYSYGLGSVQGGMGGGVLQNSSSYTISRSADSRAVAPAIGTGTIAPAATGSRVIYRSGGGVVPEVSGPGISSRLMNMSREEILAAASMAEAIGVGELELETDEPIRSFAGDDPGRYSKFLREGEESFRGGNYELALQKFLLANDIGRRAPESLLSLAHANLALGRYNSAKFYLQQALMSLPELPLANISFRNFFGNYLAYSDVREHLLARAQERQTEAASWMLAAYVLWFGDDAAGAADALRKAAAANEDPATAEAIATFWDGCVASGKVSGSLYAAEPQEPPADAPGS